MAERYLKATGNWNDTATWSATDGGAAGASFPTSSDNVHFTANSDGLTLTVNVISACLDLVADEANTATLAGGSNLRIFGSLTFVSGMSVTFSGSYQMETTSASTITTGGLDLSSTSFVHFKGIGGGWTLQDTFNVGAKDIYHERATLNTNGQTVTCGAFHWHLNNAKTLTLGASTINCTEWDGTGTSTTFNANTSTIKVTGTGAFTGQGETYNNVELNGTTHTISGSNTFKSLKIGRAAAVTITGTAGTIQTVESFFATNSANVLTLNSTGAAWTLTGNSGYCELNYTNLTNVVAGYKYMYYAGDNSTDGGGNTNWIFTRKVRVSMFPRG